jgi:hypothetical protein
MDFFIPSALFQRLARAAAARPASRRDVVALLLRPHVGHGVRFDDFGQFAGN